MSRIFMKVKKIVLPVMAAIILISQLSGCAAVPSDEMVNMINEGQTIVLEVNQPTDYSISVKGEEKQDVEWVQLDQLKTYNDGFRQGFDELFNINIVTTGLGSKQGCLFVKNVEDTDVHSGNATMFDAFRNKAFIENYWKNSELITELTSLCEKAYTDVDRNSSSALSATLNAYYNLLNDSENPTSFNATQSVTREQFYTMLFKATTGVTQLDYTPSSDVFAMSVGGDTEYTVYAKQVANYGFLDYANSSLDKTNIGSSISRIEAIYMLINQNFPDLLEQADTSKKVASDAKSAGDLALKLGFKEKDKKSDVVTEKDRWQSYTLAYMFKNTDKGIQDELYRALVVAYDLGIVTDSESRWSEALSKDEAIELLTKTFEAMNNKYGYLSTSEYPAIEEANARDESKPTIDDYAPGIGSEITDGIADAKIYTLDMLNEEQLGIFQTASELHVDAVKSGSMTILDMNIQQDEYITIFVNTNDLPANGVALYNEWKELNNYDSQFTEQEKESLKPVENKETETPAQPNNGANIINNTGVADSKPVPNVQQQQQQQQEVEDSQTMTPEQQANLDAHNAEVAAGGGGADQSGVEWMEQQSQKTGDQLIEEGFIVVDHP